MNWYKSFYLGIQREDDTGEVYRPESVKEPMGYDADLLGERANIRVPTLFFQGLRDAVCIPPIAIPQRNYISDLTTVELDADHFIMEGERGEDL